MFSKAACLMLVAAGLVLSAANVPAAEVTAERSERGVVVKIDGKLFTEYLTCSGGKPILWPIIGPTGKPMTRAYPMSKGPNEREDHIHHRSLWFTHGDVNGVSTWLEGKDQGPIEHRDFVKLQSGPRAVIVTRNDWNDNKSNKLCEDERTLTFGTDGDARWIDFDITLKATEGPVKLGDTKEGCMGVRVAGTIKETAKLGGRIINSEGQTSQDAWGKPAAWVDYHGPVDGKTVGVAMLNHPSSFRFPTYWHVRTYGLFTANPFGLHNFLGDEKADGSHSMAKGESITLRYRIIFHRGDEKAAKVAEAFAAYAKEKK